MPKIRKIKTSDRKDNRGGGYAKRKFTFYEAEGIRGGVWGWQHIYLCSCKKAWCITTFNVSTY